MLKPKTEGSIKGGEPSWISRCREFMNPRVIGFILPALGLAALVIVFTGNQMAKVRLSPDDAQIKTTAAASTPPTQKEASVQKPSTTDDNSAAANQTSSPDYTANANTQDVQPTNTGVMGLSTQQVTQTTGCNQLAKDTATSAYNTSLKIENEYHNSQLGSLLGKLLGSLKLIDENKRHDQAIQQIESTYQSRLTETGC